MSKPKTLKGILNIIDETLAAGGETARDLWTVLSALRGPDSDTGLVKTEITAPIRTNAFPKAAKTGNIVRGHYYVNSMQFAREGTELPKNIPDVEGEWHFRHHARLAVEVLKKLREVKKNAK
jgi:hypothetical protein